MVVFVWYNAIMFDSFQEIINTILELTSKLSIDTSAYDSSLAMINQQKA